MKRISFTLLLCSLLLSAAGGCDGGDPNADNTVQQDVSAIEGALDGLLRSISALESGGLSAAFKGFTRLSNGEIESDWAEDLVGELGDILDFDQIEDQLAFDYGARTGVYEWSSSQQSWSRTGPSSNIVLRFPSSESQGSNNAILTVSTYQDVAVTVDGDRYRLPSALRADLEIDGNKLFEINLRDLEYESGNDLPVPTRLQLDLFTEPLEHRLTLRRTSSDVYDLSAEVTHDDERVTELEGTVELAQTDYDELEIEDLVRVDAELRLGDEFRAVFDGRPGQIASLDDPVEADINALFSARVFLGDNQVGDIEYREANDEVVVVYKDGTSEGSQRYYESRLDRLETIVEDYLGLF